MWDARTGEMGYGNRIAGLCSATNEPPVTLKIHVNRAPWR
jgi:hypothetical protein